MIDEIKKCAEVLQAGGLILYPTDTIWGIGCDATNEKAVEKIYQLKKRDDTKAMIVLLENETRLESYVDEVPEVAWDLIECADKPMTIIYDKAKNIAPNLIAKDGSIGIRITKDEFCQKLLFRFRKPIVSTSANVSGENYPQNFDDISEEIKEGVDYIVDLRQQERNATEPSSIIKLSVGGKIKIIRK